MFFFFLIKKCNPIYRKLNDITKILFSESIKKFLEIHLKKKKIQIEKGETNAPFFFEGSQVDEEFDYGDEKNPGIDNLPIDHEIVDSPFVATPSRNIDDIRDFIHVMEYIIKIKEGEVKIFEKLFNVNEKVAKTVSTVYKSVSNQDLESHLSVLLNLSRKVEIKLGITGVNDKPGKDVHDDLFNDSSEQQAIEKTLTKEQLNQSFFLQFILLFTGTKLNYLLTTSIVEKYKMQKKLNNLFFEINKFLPRSQKLIASDIDFDQVFPSLFESGFFKKISLYFFHKVKPFLKDIKNPESIFGIIIGLSIQNKNLIRNSLIKLIGPEIKPKYINGVFGFIVNDPNQEKDMRAVMKKFNLNSNLGLSLVELVTDATQRDKYNAALSICKKYCTASRRVSAMVAMFKKDLSNIRVISERLDVDTDIMSAVLACAAKRLDLLQENFKVLSYKLGINNTFALRNLLNIACADKKSIHVLKDKKNSFFNIKDVDLLDAIMFLTNEGTKMRDEHTRFDIKDSTFACQMVYEALKSVLGITKSKAEDSDDDVTNNTSMILNKSKPKDGKKDLSFEEIDDEGALDFDLKGLMDTDDALLANIQLLVDASWNDGKALSILADSISTSEKREPGSVHEIWAHYPEKGKEILTKKLRGVFNGATESLAIMDDIMATKIKENMKYMDSLEKGEPAQFDDLSDDDFKVINSLKDEDAKTAYKIGCTYNITGFRELNQEFKYCETCEAETGEDVVICLCCAEFCHAGHRLMKGNKGKRGRIVCSCGSNTFPNCPVNDQGNPLEEIHGKGSLPPTACSIVKEYSGDRSQLGKQVRDLIDKMNNKKTKGSSLKGLMDLKNGSDKMMVPRNIKTSENQPRKNSLIKEELDVENSIDKLEEEFKQINGTPENDGNELEGGDSDSDYSNSDFEGGENDNDLSKLVEEKNKPQIIDSDNDTNEAEEYEACLSNYTSQLFMRDLINVLKFDLSEVKNNCPKLVKRNFRMFDESLQRRVHIYEHIIHLAHGFCRPGFIKFITHEGLLNNDSLHRVSKPYEPGFNKFYDTCISFVSAFQGDLENFSKYCKGLLQALGLEGNTDFPAREKAIMILMLIKGDSIDDEIQGISATNNQYSSIFKKLFGKQCRKAMYLHKFATMADEELVTLFTANEQSHKTTQVMDAKKLRTFLVDQFLTKDLEMDTDSIEWLSALTRIAMGDYDGFDYITKEYEISNTKAEIYKAICTRDYTMMDALFHAIDEEVPFELCTSISWILSGDINSVRDLIMNRLHIETQDSKFKITYDNVYKVDLPKRLQSEKNDLGDYLMILFSLIEGESFNIKDLKSIIRLCGIDEGMAHILIGFNAILNKDFIHVHDLFDFQQFKDELDNMELVHSVIKLGSNKWTKESLKTLIEGIIVSENLYTHCNIPEKVELMSKSVEFTAVINMIEAIEGDMQSLGSICDDIFFDNKSWICSLFAILNEGKFSLSSICGEKNGELAKKKFVKDIKRLFESLFSVA